MNRAARGYRTAEAEVGCIGRRERGGLSMAEAGELLGMSERQFRRYRDRHAEDGLDGLLDGRLRKRVAANAVRELLELNRNAYPGWNVKHFHEHLVRDHRFKWGYTFVKAQLHRAGLIDRAKERGAHRRKRERKAVRRHDAAPGGLARSLAS
jgi:transposase